MVGIEKNSKNPGKISSFPNGQQFSNNQDIESTICNGFNYHLVLFFLCQKISQSQAMKRIGSF
jgi:hypothetical protein